MIRKIVQIDEEKCNGCGLCVQACHEGAIELVDGKARLVSEEYCDGLGDCLPECPVGAIKIIERDAAAYDEEKVKERQRKLQEKESTPEEPRLACGCPGTLAKLIHREEPSVKNTPGQRGETGEERSVGQIPSELRQWPVQLMLVNPEASYLKNADLLIAADCTAYAYGAFHRDFIKGRITLIGCPKLDDNEYYREKIAEILQKNHPRSITVVRMEVPCCGGIVGAVKEAMLRTKTIVPYNEVIVSTGGEILDS